MLELNPQVSAPTNGIPNRFELSTDGIDHRRSSHVDLLSPVQCPATFPDPGKVLRAMMNGRLPFVSLASARCVARDSVKPKRLCACSSGTPPWCVAEALMVIVPSGFSAPTLLIRYLGFPSADRSGLGRRQHRVWARSSQSRGTELAIPSQKLDTSFMSSQMPSTGTLERKPANSASQYWAAAGCRKSG